MNAALFLGSDRVVRLMDRDPSGRTPPRWSTAAHRHVEDGVLANLDHLSQRSEVPVDPAVVELTLAVPDRLGEDQAEAVLVLVGPGGAVRASSVNLEMTRYTEQGTQVFRHQAIALADGDTAELQFGTWTNTNEGIPLVTTHNGQQSTRTLANQGTGKQRGTRPLRSSGPTRRQWRS